jgi:hypothetical protein
MPRRKATASTTTKTPPSKLHKRQLSSPATPTATSITGSRQSKRIKSSTDNTPTANGTGKATPKKSKYFEGPDSDEEEDDEDQHEASSAAEDEEEEEASGYEEASASVTSASPSVRSSEDEDDYDSDDAPRERRKKPAAVRGRLAGGANAATASTTAVGGIIEKGRELWRQGVKAGLGPGKAVFIERPKPRGDGGIPYVPGRIHPNTMAFLGDLKRNNEREWLKSEWGFHFQCLFSCNGIVWFRAGIVS